MFGFLLDLHTIDVAFEDHRVEHVGGEANENKVGGESKNCYVEHRCTMASHNTISSSVATFQLNDGVVVVIVSTKYVLLDQIQFIDRILRHTCTHRFTQNYCYFSREFVTIVKNLKEMNVKRFRHFWVANDNAVDADMELCVRLRVSRLYCLLLHNFARITFGGVVANKMKLFWMKALSQKLQLWMIIQQWRKIERHRVIAT